MLGNIVFGLAGTELREPAAVKPDSEKPPPGGRSEPLGASVGTELRLPALVQPEEPLDLVLSFGGPLVAATKWLLYWAWRDTRKEKD